MHYPFCTWTAPPVLPPSQRTVRHPAPGRHPATPTHPDDYAVFGDTSLEVDGSGDYVTAPDHADWDFDSGDFTVDFWARTRHPSTQGVIWSQKTDNDNMVYFRRSDSATNTYQFVMRTGGADTIDLSAAAGLGWNHWAIVRNDNTWYLFCNGVSKDTATDATDYPDLTGVMYLGSGNIGGTDYRFNGYIDEFRVSKGVARWTSDFTVPTEAYTETERLYMIIGSPHILSGVYFDVKRPTRTRQRSQATGTPTTGGRGRCSPTVPHPGVSLWHRMGG
jgi:hypothetical protein